MMKLVENGSGRGELMRKGDTTRPVRYEFRRYQGVMDGSGLPIPGLFRIEGSIGFDTAKASDDWIDIPLTLKLEDGRSLGIVLVDHEGRILSEGHGPLKCMCC
jgi:hypothetical protein